MKTKEPWTYFIHTTDSDSVHCSFRKFYWEVVKLSSARLIVWDITKSESTCPTPFKLWTCSNKLTATVLVQKRTENQKSNIPYWRILENSSRNFSEISVFWGVIQTDFWKTHPIFFRNSVTPWKSLHTILLDEFFFEIGSRHALKGSSDTSHFIF